MIKHNPRRSQITIAAAAALLGAVLLPGAAFAQARNVNDGGQVNVAPGAKLDGGKKITTQAYYGRSADDGGTGPQPTTFSAATPMSSRTLHMQVGAPAPTQPGRAANDGGPTN